METAEITQQEIDNALKIECLMMIGVYVPFACREYGTFGDLYYFPTSDRFVKVVNGDKEKSIETYSNKPNVNYKLKDLIKINKTITQVPIHEFWSEYQYVQIELEKMFHHRWDQMTDPGVPEIKDDISF